MEMLHDYKKFAILYVDDEEKSLKYFARAFEDTFRILTASNAREGLATLEAHADEIGLLMTDQRMPGEKGVWLLEQARLLRPGIIRVLATAFADMESAIAAVNTGAVYKYITKPWDPAQLEITLKRGLEFFIVQRERDQLLREKMSVLNNMMMADRIVSLGLLAAGLSHHIRNPLTAVKTFLDLAPAKMEEEKDKLDGLRNPDFWKEYYQSVQAQMDKVNTLLKDLWSASERPAGEFTDRLALRVVVDEVVAQLGDAFKQREVRLVNEIPDSLPAIGADRVKIYRLFEFLLRDELTNLPAGTQIKLTGRPSENSLTGKPEVEIQLQDDGPGLPAEALRLLFDPFVVRVDSPMEYGIHLMACYFIVHHHGGGIEAQSAKDQGTTFTLRLPVNPAASPRNSDQDFIHKALLSQKLWEGLISKE